MTQKIGVEDWVDLHRLREPQLSDEEVSFENTLDLLTAPLYANLRLIHLVYVLCLSQSLSLRFHLLGPSHDCLSDDKLYRFALK